MGIKEDLFALLKKYGVMKSEESPSTDKEEMIAYEVIYEPDVKDTHGEWMRVETLEKACQDFNKFLKSGEVVPNLFHEVETELFSIEDTWIQKEFDVTVTETGQPIKAGTWVAKLKYHSEDLWELKKMGVLGGVSVGAMGLVDETTGEIKELIFDEDLGEGNDD